MWNTLPILLFVLFPTYAEKRASLLKSLPTPPAKVLIRRPILIEIESQEDLEAKLSTLKPELTEKSSTLNPNRIYRYFNENENRWDWILTDRHGNVPDPLEFLRFYSVVPGTLLGVKNDQRYILDPEKKYWIKTFYPERYFYWYFWPDFERRKIKMLLFDDTSIETKALSPTLPKPTTENTLLLFNLQKNGYEKLPSQTQLPPERLLAWFNKENSAWYLTTSDKQGQLPFPLEAIHPGTTLRGNFLGARDPNVLYVLTSQGLWVETKIHDLYTSTIFSSPTKTKRIQFDNQIGWK